LDKKDKKVKDLECLVLSGLGVDVDKIGNNTRERFIKFVLDQSTESGHLDQFVDPTDEINKNINRMRNTLKINFKLDPKIIEKLIQSEENDELANLIRRNTSNTEDFVKIRRIINGIHCWEHKLEIRWKAYS